MDSTGKQPVVPPVNTTMGNVIGLGGIGASLLIGSLIGKITGSRVAEWTVLAGGALISGVAEAELNEHVRRVMERPAASRSGDSL